MQMEENHRKEIEQEKEKYQKKLEEMETKLSKLTTAPFSSTLQVILFKQFKVKSRPVRIKIK
jgi:hypothetical protein